jgi:hypothetical protein
MVPIGDSHARSCTSKLLVKFKEQYEVIGYVLPGADAAVLTKNQWFNRKGYSYVLCRNK